MFLLLTVVFIHQNWMQIVPYQLVIKLTDQQVLRKRVLEFVFITFLDPFVVHFRYFVHFVKLYLPYYP